MIRHLFTWIRLAFGLRWRSARPGLRELTPALRTAALLAGLLAAYGIVGRLDYQDARAAELEARAALAERSVDRLEQDKLVCLNRSGAWRLDGELWLCEATPIGRADIAYAPRAKRSEK